MKIDKKIINRILIYTLGLLTIAFGVVISANANLGISPINSVPYVVSLITQMPMSTCVIAIFSFYILLQIVILRKEFKWINLFQLAFSTLFGYFVDFARWVLGDFAIPTYFGSVFMVLISLTMIAIGISLYVDTKLIPMPSEGLCLAISQKTSLEFGTVKIILDCIYVAISATLSIMLLGELAGVREGTIITAIVVGKLIGILQKKIKPAVERICF